MKIKLSKSQWEQMGKTTGWMKKQSVQSLIQNNKTQDYRTSVSKAIDTITSQLEYAKNQMLSWNDASGYSVEDLIQRLQSNIRFPIYQTLKSAVGPIERDVDYGDQQPQQPQA